MSIKKDIQNILIIILGFLVLFFFFRWKGFLVIGALLGIPGLLSPFLRTYILKGWNKLSGILGFINSRIILSLIFYLVLTPIALLSRIFSKDRLQLKKKKQKKGTYFYQRDYDYQPSDFEHPW